MWPFWLSQEVPVALASDDGDLDKVGPVPAKDGWPAPKQLSTVGIGASATVSVTVAKLMHTLSLAGTLLDLRYPRPEVHRPGRAHDRPFRRLRNQWRERLRAASLAAAVKSDPATSVVT